VCIKAYVNLAHYELNLLMKEEDILFCNAYWRYFILFYFMVNRYNLSLI